MKTRFLLPFIIAATAALPIAAQADDQSVESSRIYRVEGIRLTMPVVIQTQAPSGISNLIGHEVEMIFTINEKGKATRVTTAQPYRDVPRMELSTAMEQALKGWRFLPAKDGSGDAHALKVRLPVRVIDGRGKKPQVYATLHIAEDTKS